MLLRGDWTLRRQGPDDEARHQERVREALASHVQDLAADPALFAAPGAVLPVRALREYRFHFASGEPAVVHERTGPGTASVGCPAPGAAPPGAPAGTEPGRDGLDVELAIDDLGEMIFPQLHLPERPGAPGPAARAAEDRGGSPRTRGPLSALDWRRSLLANVRRNARAGRPEVGGWSTEDLRFRDVAPVCREAAAAVIAMRDVSGSMGEYKKALARAFFFWMVRFLRARYAGLEVVFIAHHTAAREVGEDAFFRLAESGGTRASAAYALALDIMRARYGAARWNVYACHFSDGDNWGEADNRLCVDLAREMLALGSGLGYAETAEPGYRSPLLGALEAIADPRFAIMSLHERRDVLRALRRFFRPPQGQPAP